MTFSSSQSCDTKPPTSSEVNIGMLPPLILLLAAIEKLIAPRSSSAEMALSWWVMTLLKCMPSWRRRMLFRKSKSSTKRQPCNSVCEPHVHTHKHTSSNCSYSSSICLGFLTVDGGTTLVFLVIDDGCGLPTRLATYIPASLTWPSYSSFRLVAVLVVL